MTDHSRTHIGILIPCTSKGRDGWTDIKSTYLYNMTVKTLLMTQNDCYDYTVCVGYDTGDRIFSDPAAHAEISRLSAVFKSLRFQFIEMKDVTKGHVTVMWNILFRRAYDAGCDYFYQCGDDIVFHTKGWTRDCIVALESHDGYGLVGPINNNNHILTQAFVSRRHMEVFGFFFPEEIINWCCDDWYNEVYAPTHLFPLRSHYCSNNGGPPRYTINNDPTYEADAMNKTMRLRQETSVIAQRDRTKLMNHINSKCTFSTPIVMSQLDLFWQYPVITEKAFYEQNKSNPSYLGLPWATILDKRRDLSKIKQCVSSCTIKGKSYYTCCQQIEFWRLIPLFEALNIVTVYTPHKIIGEDRIGKVNLLPCPLYAVNVEDPDRNNLFSGIDFLNKHRRLLYSFQGAYDARWYLTDIRKRIFDTPHPPDCFVSHIGGWHFDKVVYSEKQNSKYQLNEDDTDAQRTSKYNTLLLDSRYSLCPSGTGTNSIRFWECLAIGSILILLADTLELPDHELWDQTIVRIPELELATIPKILAKITPEEERIRRQNCIDIYAFFKNNYTNIV